MGEIEEINKYLKKIQDRQNNRSISDFEGYSPIEMQYILYNTFDNNSPIELLELNDTEIKKIPLLNQIKYLLHIINDSGELKLTAKGFLPIKIVSDIYNQKFIKDEMDEYWLNKRIKETDIKTINLTRILIELSGLVKKRKNKLSLTKKGIKELNDNNKLLKSIFITFCTEFNWAYYDGYRDSEIGRFGFGFSLILLSKYGSKKRLEKFYAKKYLIAFPSLREQSEQIYAMKMDQIYSAYSLRTFNRFLDYFGLIKIESENKWDSDKFIKKTDLFDKLIKIKPHKTFI